MQVADCMLAIGIDKTVLGSHNSAMSQGRMTMKEFQKLFLLISTTQPEDVERLQGKPFWQWEELIRAHQLDREHVTNIKTFDETKEIFLGRYPQFEECLKDIDDVRCTNATLSAHIKEMKAPPSDYQLATAQICAKLALKISKQVHIVYGGHGKSRIAIMTALILL